MAVWLTMSLSQGTPNTTARTTTVSATLTIHYNGGSYDGTQPSGTITIDGQSFPFVKNFNYAGVGQGAATQGEGSTSITVTATVPYGTSSSRTVYASASFSRASGGASGAITLTPISSGGSSGGGDDGDDDNTEEWDPDNPGTGGSGGGSGGDEPTPEEYTISIAAGIGCNVNVIRNDIMLSLTDGDPIYEGDFLAIYFSAFPGYRILTHTVDGSEFNNGYVHVVHGNVEIVVTAEVDENDEGDEGGAGTTINTRGVFLIDNGTEFVAYECYIDNGTGWDPVLSVSEGAAVQVSGRVEGNSDSDIFVPVECGFTPDVVTLSFGESDNVHTQYTLAATAAFTALGKTEICTSMWSERFNTDLYVYFTQRENGFDFCVLVDLSNFNYEFGTFSYTAIKYT